MLVNDIAKYDSFDYDRALSSVVNYALSQNGLSLIGSFGEICTPSISDIDLFIVYDDLHYTINRNQIINHIAKDSKLKYIFVHEPLLIPRSLLGATSHLHTLNNLKIIYKRDDISYSPSNDDINFLNFIWTLYLIPHCINIVFSRNNISCRAMLLLLKNVSKSINNLAQNDTNYICQKKLRNEFLNGKVSNLDLYHLFRTTIDKLFYALTKYKICLNRYPQCRSYRYSKTIIYKEDAFCGYHEPDKLQQILITLTPNILFILESYLRRNKTELMSINPNYYIASIQAATTFKRLKSPYPFISPFNIEFYRTDFPYLAKCIIKRLF